MFFIVSVLVNYNNPYAHSILTSMLSRTTLQKVRDVVTASVFMSFIVITCNEPASIEHGNFIKPRNIPEADDVIEYFCNENYTLSGNRFITCENWEYNSPPPKCKG